MRRSRNPKKTSEPAARRARAPAPPVHGVLVLDKPRGPTSHDIVALVRRALGTRSVGHAGTLDPMATGVLVVAVGEATKLVPYLTADDKEYEATVCLGVATDTLDAEGAVTLRSAVPEHVDRAAVERAAAAFIGETMQRAPDVSAIRRGGERLYEKARRGEDVDAPERKVVVHRVDVVEAREHEIDLRVHCGKGFYVRALARDLAAALGTCGHLSALRRIASGAFAVTEAVDFERIRAAADGDEDARVWVRSQLIRTADACRSLPRATLDDAGENDARHGRPVPLARVTSGLGGALASGEPVALLAPSGELVAIAVAAPEEGTLRVARGFSPAS